MIGDYRPLASQLPDEAADALNEVVERFERDAELGRAGNWEDYLPDSDSVYSNVLAAELIKSDQGFRLSRGEFRPIEDYLLESQQAFSDAILVDLLHGECVNRQEFGCSADVAELRRRFPHLEGHDGFSVFLACEPPATDSGNSERLDGRTEFRDPVPQSGDLRNVNGKKFGKFVLRKVLGYGAMGVVFRAYDSILGRDVALKIPAAAPTFAGMIDGDGAATVLSTARLQAFDDRFLQEARAQAKVDHPNICEIYECRQVGAIPYLSMKILEGLPLNRWLDENDAIDPWQAAEIACRLADALRALHEHGLLHRDVKSANVVLVDEHDDTPRLRSRTRRRMLHGLNPILVDFGVAQTSQPVTTPDEFVGTPAFMPPEQAEGQPVDGRSDVYSLGIVLYHMLTGRLPFEGSTRKVLDAADRGSADNLQEIRSDIPPGLAAACMRAMARDPGARFASAAEFADEIERVCSQRRRRQWIARGTLVVVLIVAIVFAFRWLFPSGGQQSSEHAFRSKEPASKPLELEIENTNDRKYIERLKDGKPVVSADPWHPSNKQFRSSLLHHIEKHPTSPNARSAIKLLRSVPWPHFHDLKAQRIWWDRRPISDGGESRPFRIPLGCALIVTGKIPANIGADRMRFWVDGEQSVAFLKIQLRSVSREFSPRLRLRGPVISGRSTGHTQGTSPTGWRNFACMVRVSRQDGWTTVEVQRGEGEPRDVDAEYYLRIDNSQSEARPTEFDLQQARLQRIREQLKERKIQPEVRHRLRRELLTTLQDPRPIPEVQVAALLLCRKLWHGVWNPPVTAVRATKAGERRTRTTFPVSPDRPLLLFERLGPHPRAPKPRNSLRIVGESGKPICIRLISLSPGFEPLMKLQWADQRGRGKRELRSNSSAAPWLHATYDRIGRLPNSPDNKVILTITSNTTLSLSDIDAGGRRPPHGEYLLLAWQSKVVK